MSETIVVKTNVAAANKTIVMPDGTLIAVKFQAVPSHERDPLVRVYVRLGAVLLRIGTGRHTGTGDTAILTFTYTAPAANGCDIAFAETFGSALREVAPTIFDLVLTV